MGRYIIMRRKFLVAWMLSALAWGVAGATTVTNQGAVFRFSEWSPPQLLQVASPNGYEALLSRSATVQIVDGYKRVTRELVRLYFPAHREMWIGPKGDYYAISGNKIWGIRTQNGRILIKHSVHRAVETPEDSTDLPAYAEAVGDDALGSMRDRETRAFTALQIFGIHKSYALNAAPLYDDGFYLTGVEVVAAGIKVSMRCNSLSYPQTITFNASQDIVSIVHGTQSIPPVSNPFKVVSNYPFTQYSIRTIDTDHGDDMALQANRDYRVAPPQTGRQNAPVSVVRMGFTINAATGRMLFGPRDCVVVDIGGTLYGIDIRDQAIRVYWRQNTRLPFDEHAFAACQEQCRAWETALANNHYTLQPDAVFRLPEIFANDSRFLKAYEFSFKAITVINGNILVSMYCDANRTCPEVVISPDMKVVSHVVKTY